MNHKTELAKDLFQLPNPGEAKGSSGEIKIKVAHQVGRLIMFDMVGRAQMLWRDHGPGVLVFTHEGQNIQWCDPDEIAEQLSIAESCGDTGLADVFREMLRRLEKIDPKQSVLMAIADQRGLRLLQPRLDNPTPELDRLLSAWNQ